MNDQLLDQVALRLRHNAAMDAVEHADHDERYELLWGVLAPSQRLLELSVARARADLTRRHTREQAAA